MRCARRLPKSLVYVKRRFDSFPRAELAGVRMDDGVFSAAKFTRMLTLRSHNDRGNRQHELRASADFPACVHAAAVRVPH